MKRLFWVALMIPIFLLPASGCIAEEKAQSPVELKDLKDKVSYAIGLSIGRDFKNQDLEINPDILAQGIRDSLQGNDPLMSDEEIKETQMAFQEEVRAKQQKLMEMAAEKNVQKEQTFLEQNKKKEGVKVTESGLQYEIIEEGTGPKPDPTDQVKVHYSGTLLTGSEFDSSYQRGEPAVFPVNAVIPGWTEALQMMKEGAKWKLYIPSRLAYGERGAGQSIGPNETLVFTVELLEVMKEDQEGKGTKEQKKD